MFFTGQRSAVAFPIPRGWFDPPIHHCPQLKIPSKFSLMGRFRRPWIVVAPILLILLAATVVVTWLGYDPIDWATLAGDLRSLTLMLLQGIHPVAYFACFALAPAVGMPITFFYLTAATVLGSGSSGLIGGILLSWIAIGANIAFGYWLARGWMRPLIAGCLRRRGHEIPKALPENEGQMIFAVRFSPLPFAAQSWILGVARFRFGRYLAYSWMIQIGMGTGVILLGESLLQGGMGLAFFGIFLICLFLIATRHRRRRVAMAPQAET
jgi:hypothetical protein